MRVIVLGAKWILASLAASLAAAVVYSVILSSLAIVGEMIDGNGVQLSALWGVVGFFVAVPVHFVGIAVAGPIAQVLLTRTSRNGAIAAAIAGAGLALSGALLLFGIVAGWAGLLLAIPTPLSGAIGGVVFRKVMLGYH